MTVVLIIAIILLVGGLLFIVSPGTIIKLNQASQKLVFGEPEVLTHRYQTGILLLITGILMVLMYIKWS
ncbi:MAG: hypothetical protein V1653_02730 [bacterium]